MVKVVVFNKYAFIYKNGDKMSMRLKNIVMAAGIVTGISFANRSVMADEKPSMITTKKVNTTIIARVVRKGDFVHTSNGNIEILDITKDNIVINFETRVGGMKLATDPISIQAGNGLTIYKNTLPDDYTTVNVVSIVKNGRVYTASLVVLAQTTSFE